MSRLDKRVRISYTVEMNEVPARIAALLRETESNATDFLKELSSTASNLEKEGATQKAYDSVDEMRRSMVKLDLRLEDIQALLGSYQAALVEFKQQSQQKNQEVPQSHDEIVIEEDE